MRRADLPAANPAAGSAVVSRASLHIRDAAKQPSALSANLRSMNKSARDEEKAAELDVVALSYQS
jgi:hypothetical protein